MLKIYRAPNGSTWQYEEGKQPAGYVPVEREKQPEAAEPVEVKESKPMNKAAKAKNKGA